MASIWGSDGYWDSINRRLNNSGNAVVFDTTLQFLGITNLIVFAGFTEGNVSPRKFDGLIKLC